MKVGDTVNIKSTTNIKSWKGKITKINTQHNDIEINSLISVREINGKNYALFFEYELDFKDGEYWEI